MATKKPDPPAAPPRSEEKYLPGDPIPAAEATEADTDSVWALFSEAPDVADPEFPQTERGPLR